MLHAIVVVFATLKAEEGSQSMHASTPQNDASPLGPELVVSRSEMIELIKYTMALV